MKKILISFLSTNYKQKNVKLIEDAKKINFYDEVHLYNEKDLQDEFVKKNFRILKNEVRGYGYWIWKPQIILQTLSRIKNGDIVQYTDAGCHLNKKGIQRLEEYFSLANESRSGILAFQTGIKIRGIENFHKFPVYLEREWTKADVFKFMDVDSHSHIINSPQIGAGLIFIRKSEVAVKIISKWLDIMQNNLNLIDDSKSFIQNFNDFKENRHDQSIFSVLCKLNGVECASAYEYWLPRKNSNKPDWKALQEYPIHARRDITLRHRYKIKRGLKLITRVINRG